MNKHSGAMGVEAARDISARHAASGRTDRPRPRDDAGARRPLAGATQAAPGPAEDRRRHAGGRVLPRAAAQALGRLRDGPAHVLRHPARARRGRHVDRLDLRRAGRASLVHGAAGRPRRAGGVGRRHLDTDLLVADAGRQGHRDRRRLPPQRPLALRQRLRALRLGAARRLVASTDGGPPEGRIFLVPRQDYRTVDTWQVSGLQGDRQHRRHPRRRVRAGLPHPGDDRQFQADRGRAGGEHRQPLPAAVRADLRARHLDQRARRLAGHARRNSWTTAGRGCRARAAARPKIRWCSCSAPRPPARSTR